MGFVRSVLAPGETLIVHTHPHWRALVRPALVTLVVGILLLLAGLALLLRSTGRLRGLRRSARPTTEEGSA